jgi:hypothetical protein
MTLTKKTQGDNDLIIVELDRPRFLRFGHKSLKKLTLITGWDLDNMENAKFGLEDLEKVMWCGLQQDAIENNEELKYEMMEDLLDKAGSYGDLLDAMNEALAKAFQKTTKEKN